VSAETAGMAECVSSAPGSSARSSSCCSKHSTWHSAPLSGDRLATGTQVIAREAPSGCNDLHRQGQYDYASSPLVLGW
jgi:hypothetical protein